MEIGIEQGGGVAVVRCVGSLDAGSIGVFKEKVYAVVSQGMHRWIVDAQRLTFIDSVGLGVLISLSRKLRERDGEVKIAAPTEDVRSIFEITRLHRLFDLCDSTDDAKKRFLSKSA